MTVFSLFGKDCLEIIYVHITAELADGTIHRGQVSFGYLTLVLAIAFFKLNFIISRPG